MANFVQFILEHPVNNILNGETRRQTATNTEQLVE